MASPPIPREHDCFDEAGYLRLNPGIAEVVAAGNEPSGWHHFDKHGRREGRRPNDVDPAFYLDAYQQAAAEIAAGLAGDAAEHYVMRGRARGYLPNATVKREPLPPVPAAFPWLWTDLPHAADLIDGRLELGPLNQRQAALLRHWVRNGFVVLDRVVDRDRVTAAVLDLERGFAGAIPDLLFDCAAIGKTPIHWQPEINPHPARSLDPHVLSQSIRAVLLAEPIREFLGLIFEAPALVAQTHGVLREAPSRAQREVDTAGFTLSRQFAAAWISLEDPAENAGTRYHFVGSHRFPHVPASALERHAPGLGLLPDPFVGALGRVVIRHPDLIHGGTADAELATQRGVHVRYCPAFVAPLYDEAMSTRLWRRDGLRFSSRHYPDLEPRD